MCCRNGATVDWQSDAKNERGSVRQQEGHGLCDFFGLAVTVQGLGRDEQFLCFNGDAGHHRVRLLDLDAIAERIPNARTPFGYNGRQTIPTDVGRKPHPSRD